MPTFPPIHNWTDGLLAIRQRAISTRGVIELDDGPKWPRTTGDDVVLIAALFHPAVRALRGTAAGAARRWRAALDIIERTALVTPGDTYADNRNFWNTLELVAVTLDDQAAPVPSSDAWHNLIHELGTRPRNASPRGDALAVFAAMATDLRARRGTLPDVELAGLEIGTTNTHAIPVLTNGDALQLAIFWSQWLAETPNTDGNGILVRAHWHDATDEVDATAAPGTPSARYANAAELWAACAAVAAYISAASHAASPRNAKRTTRRDAEQLDAEAEPAATAAEHADDDIADASLDSDTPLAPEADDIAIDRNDPIERYAARLSELRATRGTDLLPPPAGWVEPMGGEAYPFSVPRLTTADARELVTEWTARLAGPLGTSPVMGTPSARAVLDEWRWAAYDVKRLAHGADPDAVFEYRNHLTRTLNQLAIVLSAAYRIANDEQPRNGDAYTDFTVKTYPQGHTASPQLRWFRAEAPITWIEARDRLAAAGVLDPALAGRTSAPGGWMLSVDRSDFSAARAEPLPGRPRNAPGSTLAGWLAPSAPPLSAPPFGPFPSDIQTLDDLYRAQRATLRIQRGTDHAPGFGGATVAIPRTTNADVVQLADWWNALYTAQQDHIAEVVARSGIRFDATPWEAVVRDVNRIARTGTPTGVYRYNAAFWRALGDVATETALAVELPLSWRYDGGAIAGTTVADGLAASVQRTDPLALYTGFLQKYQAERGSDVMAPPPGIGGTVRAIPRTTNADLLTLATWCNDELAATPHVAGTVGDEIKRWAAAAANVTALAWQGDPDAEYERNNEFWRALAAVVTLMSATDDVRYGRTPTPNPPRNGDIPDAPPFGPFTDIKTLDDIYRAQLATLRTQRGTDNAPGFGGATVAIPRTTNADVVQLADWWNALYTAQKNHIAEVVERSGNHFDAAAWEVALSDVNSAARTGDASAVYGHNAAFWKSLGDLATETALAVELPASWLWDWTHDSPVGKAVLAVVHGAEALPGKLADAAKSAGAAIKAEVWDEIKWPLAVGGGVLGLYLLARARQERAA